MAPKKTDADQNADQMQQQMGRISLLEQSMTKVETMEQTLSAMQQQMNAFFGRWEQEKNEQGGEKARSLEADKGEAHQVGKNVDRRGADAGNERNRPSSDSDSDLGAGRRVGEKMVVLSRVRPDGGRLSQQEAGPSP